MYAKNICPTASSLMVQYLHRNVHRRTEKNISTKEIPLLPVCAYTLYYTIGFNPPHDSTYITFSSKVVI